ncbi:MAG: hypothetical protein RLZ10_1219 [Bacteroidota bacterium]|jgi:hypothetical protein
MEMNSIIQELTELLNSEDLLSLGKKAQELKVKFDDFILEEERKDQVNALNAADAGETYENQDFSPLKEAFYAVFNNFQTKRNQQKVLRDALEKENLRLKRSLIDKLQEVIENEENIGVAYNAQKEIHETWKKVGDIPREKRDEIQRDYSRMLEIFFHNMKIYRELKDHDYHRNTQLKLALINQLENLKNSSVIKDMESTLKTLQNEWEEIGPVLNDEWEKLKTQYWDAVRAVYEKINQFYNERRTSQLENLDQKKLILTAIISLNNTLSTFDNTKAWDKSSEKILKFQENWKAIGPAPKKENEEVWKEFRAACDVFFAAKKNFYKGIEEQQKLVADKKRQLILQAKEIQNSTDWKLGSEKLIRLQKEWKTCGNAGHRYENKLWAEFRGACDVFFNARENNLKEQQESFLSNYDEKMKLVQSLQNLTHSGDKKTDLTVLREIADSFKAIGHVPNEKKDEVNTAFRKALDEQYGRLNIDAGEKELILFKARFESIPSGTERMQILQKERSNLRKQIDTMNAEIIQMETNLSFFARSKGADSLRKEVDQKIVGIQQKIDGLKRKLKAIPSE